MYETSIEISRGVGVLDKIRSMREVWISSVAKSNNFNNH